MKNHVVATCPAIETMAGSAGDGTGGVVLLAVLLTGSHILVPGEPCV